MLQKKSSESKRKIRSLVLGAKSRPVFRGSNAAKEQDSCYVVRIDLADESS